MLCGGLPQSVAVELSRPEKKLLEHLVVEFGAHGHRAVEFLNTAQDLLTAGLSGSPRLPAAIAYCLREAMKAIPASQDAGDSGLWKQVSREVVDAATRYKRRKDMPGEDEQGALNDLLAGVEDLRGFHDQEGVHERRLIAVIVNRTGAAPIAAGTAPIETYQSLVVRLDGAVHGDISFAEVQDLWAQCLAILRRLFLPPEIRHAELDVLAGIESPHQEDVARLLKLVAGPNHLSHFLGQVVSPEWLELLMNNGVLEPPNENGPWPAFAAVEHLAGEHGGALATWLTRMYEKYGGEPVRGWFVARAAVDVGDEALTLVVRALKDHPTSSAILDLGVWVVEKVDPADELTAFLADVLFNEASWRSAGFVDPVVERFVDGVEAGNAEGRLRLLCFKLRAVDDSDRRICQFVYERAGSIADRTGREPDDRFTVLLNALVDAMGQAQQWLTVDELLAIVDELPPPIASRVRAWLLGSNPDVDTVHLINELTRAIGERSPTGDDLGLIDKVLELCDPSQYTEAWREALGPIPADADVERGLSTGELTKEWVRAHQWVALLPAGVAGGWARPVSVIAAAYGQPTRDTLEKRRRAEFSFGRSPIAVQQLQELTPVEAAQAIASWRPDPSEGLVSARELAGTLETLVKSTPDSWLAEPLRVATELRQPTYIHHYLSAVADTCKATPVPVDDLLHVIALVRAHPWEPISLGRNDFEFDRDWRGAEHAAVEVIKALADADVGFDDRSDEVWLILQSEVLNRGEPSGIVGGSRDPLEDAINRPCTRALDAVLSFMAHEFRTAERVRPEILELLTDSLRLDGLDGAEHRAILATRIGFLRHVAPDWMNEVKALFFGPEAPDGLGQLAVDQALKWGSTNTWLLENFRGLVRNAVTSGVEHALDHALIAMLWESPGYGVQDNIAFLRTPAPLLSQAGEALGRLLRHDEADEHLQVAMRFWHAAIATKLRDGLAGFGSFAGVEHMDSTDWASMTLQTLQISGGRIDWSDKVAERAVTLSPSETTLAIMNQLVQGTIDEWDRRVNIERAVTLLRAADRLEETPEYIRLQTTLLERGVL